MNALLTIDGTHLETGHQACLYIGLHNTTDQADKDFHRYLIRHYQHQGWQTMLTLSFLVEQRNDKEK